MEVGVLWDVIVVGLLRGGLYSLIAIGLSLILGVMSIICMTNGEFYMVGAYIAYFCFGVLRLNPIIAILAAALGTFLLGALIERGPIREMRRRSKEDWFLNTFLLTVGLSFLIKNLAQLIFGASYRGITWYWPGAVSIFGSVGISIDRLVGLGIAVGCIAGLELFLSRTRLGRAIRAVSEDERGATLAGINIANIRTLSFGIACMMGGLAGAAMLSIVPAFPYMGNSPNNYAWLVVMLAGLGNVGGAIVGGLIVGMVEAVSIQFLGAGWPSVLSAAILLLVLFLKPGGIFGTAVKGVWER